MHEPGTELLFQRLMSNAPSTLQCLCAHGLVALPAAVPARRLLPPGPQLPHGTLHRGSQVRSVFQPPAAGHVCWTWLPKLLQCFGSSCCISLRMTRLSWLLCWRNPPPSQGAGFHPSWHRCTVIQDAGARHAAVAVRTPCQLCGMAAVLRLVGCPCWARLIRRHSAVSHTCPPCSPTMVPHAAVYYLCIPRLLLAR